MKFDIIISDPPWDFSDSLSMSKVKRGSAANYNTMTNNEIKQLKIGELAEKDSVLALWVPSSLLTIGLEIMNEWGFRQTQTWVWNKIKKDPLESLRKELKKKSLLDTNSKRKVVNLDDLNHIIDNFDLSDTLNFGMGRLFRQTHELVLLGVKGKPYKELKNKSQRSVSFAPNLKHSQKPEILQDRLELMFPNYTKRLELFGRKSKLGWEVIGNESPSCIGVDIRDSIESLIKLP